VGRVSMALFLRASISPAASAKRRAMKQVTRMIICGKNPMQSNSKPRESMSFGISSYLRVQRTVQARAGGHAIADLWCHKKRQPSHQDMGEAFIIPLPFPPWHVLAPAHPVDHSKAEDHMCKYPTHGEEDECEELR